MLGMIIGVPTLAVVYRFLSGKTNEALIKKELPQDTMEYWNLEYINEKNKEFINSDK